MGDPKFSRRMYNTPSHPWKSERIKEENTLVRKYGLKNKREVWKSKSLLGRIRGQARRLTARMRTGDLQAEKEKEERDRERKLRYRIRNNPDGKEARKLRRQQEEEERMEKARAIYEAALSELKSAQKKKDN